MIYCFSPLLFFWFFFAVWLIGLGFFVFYDRCFNTEKRIRLKQFMYFKNRAVLILEFFYGYLDF